MSEARSAFLVVYCSRSGKTRRIAEWRVPAVLRTLTADEIESKQRVPSAAPENRAAWPFACPSDTQRAAQRTEVRARMPVNRRAVLGGESGFVLIGMKGCSQIERKAMQ